MLNRRAELTLLVNQARRQSRLARLGTGLLARALVFGAAVFSITGLAVAQSVPPATAPLPLSGRSTVTSGTQTNSNGVVAIDPGQPFVPRIMPRSIATPPVVVGSVAADVRPRDVVVVLNADLPERTVYELSQDFGLELNTSFPSQLLSNRVLRFRIPDTRTLADVAQQLSADARVQLAQPDYVFTVAGASKSLPGSQYAPQKMRLEEAQQVARGKNIKIAIIDTAIDQSHPAFPDAIIEAFSTLDDLKPGTGYHGTSIAGVIAARSELIGVAPQASILSVEAFAEEAAGPSQSHTLAILKGLDWAVSKGARVVNMSFSGPNDPLLGQAIAAAVKQGVVVVAAAGNGGRDAPPAYPGAFPNVIAVTAIDRKDAVFQNANRGTYIAVAAPGVEIAIAAPNAGYGVASGTSLAAAHVSGIVALMLEKNPKLSPKEVRDAISKSAHQPPRLIAEDMGAGIVDAADALAAVK
jgi:subtilisin family serine protease